MQVTMGGGWGSNSETTVKPRFPVGVTNPHGSEVVEQIVPVLEDVQEVSAHLLVALQDVTVQTRLE